MTSRFRISVSAPVGAVSGLVLGLTLTACAPAPELPVFGRVEEIRLDTSAGGTLSTGDLDGRVYVVDFIFTSCQMACPLMTAKMKKLADEFAAAPDLRLLSVTTDPGTDTVEVLHEYAARFGIDESRWIFGRAPVEELVRLSEKEFLLGASGFPAGHSLKFVLVDRDRQIRGYYDSEDPGELETLRRDLEFLLDR